MVIGAGTLTFLIYYWMDQIIFIILFQAPIGATGA